MSVVVRWTLHVRVGSREKALRKIEEEVLSRLNREVALIRDVQYWKMPELWECHLEHPISNETKPAIVYQVLRMADKIGTGWFVTGPCEEPWHFDGVLSIQSNGRSSISGLAWAQFEVELNQP